MSEPQEGETNSIEQGVEDIWLLSISFGLPQGISNRRSVTGEAIRRALESLHNIDGRALMY